MRAAESSAYFESGKRVTTSLKALNASRAPADRGPRGQAWSATTARQGLVEIDHALQVPGVVDVRVIGIELDEAVGGGDSGSALAVLPVAVGDLELRLLRVAAVG